MELLMPFGVQICSGTEWTAATTLLSVSPGAIGRFPYGEFFNRSISGRDCVFFNSRRTKTRAAGACQYAIDHWRVDPLIVLGTCGGVAEPLSVGDLIIATRTFQYDSADRRPEMGYGLEADLGWFHADQFAETLHPGTLATADHDLTFRDLPELRRENVMGADWESGAIATVCALNGIRWTIVRGVSDVPVRDGAEDAARQVDDYRRHTPAIVERLLGLLPQIIVAMAA
jgi:nucleoside phosphorylase